MLLPIVKYQKMLFQKFFHLFTKTILNCVIFTNSNNWICFDLQENNFNTFLNKFCDLPLWLFKIELKNYIENFLMLDIQHYRFLIALPSRLSNVVTLHKLSVTHSNLKMCRKNWDNCTFSKCLRKMNLAL